MMELTCAFILLSASLVLATPHGYGGYGVKGGASARAESSASAVAFGGIGGIPVPLPLGASYSGSFSKSSSSSSASSSASSSSSSSSYSFGGSAAGGFGQNGGAPGFGGCSSGKCQTAGANGIPASHGSSSQGYNSANAAASADAGAVAGLGCQGLSCDRDSQKCTSGQCNLKPQTGTTSIDSDSTKCTSGECGSSLDNGAYGAYPTDDGSNDIRVVAGSSNSAHNTKDSSIDKASPAYGSAGPDCSQGRCSSSGPLSSNPNYGHKPQNSYQGISGSNNQQASGSDTGIASHYQKPSTHLETPKLDSKCNSENCNAAPGEPGYERSPSSYNVPIQGTYDQAGRKPACDGVKCENQPNRLYSPTDNSVTVRPPSYAYPSSSNCAGSNCFGVPASQVTGGPSLTVRPNNGNYGHSPVQSPSHTPTSNVPSCNSPNCSPHSTYPAPGPNGAQGQIGHGKPNDVSKPSNDKLPVYTGGFGGPAGILNPNKYNVPAPAGNPSYGQTATSQKPSGSNPSGCNSASCSVYPSSSGSSGGPSSTGVHNHKPVGDIPNEKLPTYTGGFGGPTGTLKPDEFDVHATAPSKPNYATPGSPSYNTQPIANIGTPGCKAGGNCGGYSPTADVVYGSTAPSGYFESTKPNTVINSPNDKLPTYISGIGGPGGDFNHDKHDIHATGSPSYGHASTPQKPLISSPTGCNSPGCSVYPSASGTTGGPGPTGTYTGGFGGPTGTLKPNEYDIHSTVTTKPNYAHPGSPSYNTQPPASNIGSPGCKAGGNCGGYSPSAGATSGVTAPSANFETTKPNPILISPNDKLPSYTGGFGGPGGVFNPDKHNIHATGSISPGHTSSGAYNTPTFSGHPGGCKTPNCYATAGVTAAVNAQAESFGVTKPNSGPYLSSVTQPAHPSGYDGPSEVYRPNEISGPPSTPNFSSSQSPSSPGSYSSGCETGNCANYPSSTPSASTNAQPGFLGTTKPTDINLATPTSPQYTGGFGGPSGTFKPNENTYVTPSAGNTPTNCKTPNCIGSSAANADAISEANAHPGSYGISKPTSENKPSNDKPTYSGGFGGPSGLLKPNEYASPAVSPVPVNKPTGVSTPAACTSGNCNPHGAPATHSHNGASNGAHATAAATAEANAVAYTGGFGGPPGVLTPYDDGKIGALPSHAGQAHGPQIGGVHGIHNANIHQQGSISGTNSGSLGHAGLSGAYGITRAQAGSTAGASAQAGAAAGASAGAQGYNPHGSQFNHAGNKGGGSCGGGCGGSGGGAYNGGSGFDISGGHGVPKIGYSDGPSTSGATAKSLAGASSFGVGGIYSSSSASAHASAGAYTKGGYGKR